MVVAIVCILSAVGYASIIAIDIPTLRNRRMAKLVTIITGVGALSAAYTLMVQGGPRLNLPKWSTWVGVVFLVAGGILVIYSAWLEIPLAVERVARSSANDSREWTGNTFRGGTYALCRHPGLLWMTVCLTGLVLVTDLAPVAYLALGWFGLDLLVITVQDRVIFPNMLKGYTEYRQTTPFIIPNRNSVRAILNQNTQ